VIGLKVGVASASYRINDVQLGQYRENQNILKVERSKLENKIKELNASLESNGCSKP